MRLPIRKRMGYRIIDAQRARGIKDRCELSGLEQAIRNALERAERSDPDIRARIYQSARNALDTGLRKQEVGDPQVIDRQRQRLEMTIRDIEDEELARLRSIAAETACTLCANAPSAQGCTSPRPIGTNQAYDR